MLRLLACLTAALLVPSLVRGVELSLRSNFQGGYDSNVIPSLSVNGLQWFLVFAMPLIFVHHTVLFYIEAGGFGLFWFTLWKAFASTLFTTLVLVIVQYLFPSRRRIL